MKAESNSFLTLTAFLQTQLVGRVNDFARDRLQRQHQEMSTDVAYSLATNESTDVTATARPAVLMRTFSKK
jgi:hypothetical protein